MYYFLLFVLELSVLIVLVTEGVREILCCLVLRNVKKHLSPKCPLVPLGMKDRE